MNKDLFHQEFAISCNIALPLCKNKDYVYLFSGDSPKSLENNGLSAIKGIFASECKELIYIPEIFSELNHDVLSYNFPGTHFKLPLSPIDFMKDIIKMMQISLGDDEYAFVRYCPNNDEYRYYCFAAEGQYALKFIVEDYLSFQMMSFSSLLSRHGLMIEDCRFEFNESVTGETADLHCSLIRETTANSDDGFNSEQSELLDMAIDAVKRLQLSGVSLEVIKRFLVPEVKLSRILITRNFKILLPDYDKEIKMSPLPKTVFLFFLKHDRKFMFSDLMDYKEEILRIYGKVSNRDDKEKMRESIERLVDPLDNSICEKCTAVRTAFMEQITYDIARNYFIEGKQGMPKQILLDRSLVEWEMPV
ncbi:MAG: hypothetical protein IJ383_01755 [Bacteroidales bacterium]|nr:hypothetical protein [Bacteroidales bacterium]